MSELKKTSIGGQALIEGIMMRGPSKSAMAVRCIDGTIDVEVWENKKTRWYNRFPVLRGMTNFFSSLVVGYKCLMKSAEKSGMMDDEPKEDEIKENKSDKKTISMGILATVAAVFAVCVSLGLFILIPSLIVDALGRWINFGYFKALVEAILKMAIFITYLWACSFMKDIKRVFSYHGAEHKTIACYEAGDELIPDKIKNYTRFHPRCGTSFMLIAIIVSVIVFSIVNMENIVIKICAKILLIPLIVGISYEIIKWAGRNDNVFTRILSAPGLWLQNLTTFEPDQGMMEVAVEALRAVLPEEDENDNW